MDHPLLSRNLFHTGYAVRSMDSAIASLSGRLGISQWKVVPLPGESGGRALGFAYVQHMMIELVDVVPGGVAIYNDWIPEEPGALRLHHLGHMVHSREEFDEIAGRYAEIGVAMVMDAEMPGILNYRYFDTVPLLGHYSEYVLMQPGGDVFWQDVPRN